MAVLNDLVVSGASSLVGPVKANTIQLDSLKIPTTSNGTTYGTGTDGQILKTNGTTVYWGNQTNTYVHPSHTAYSSGLYKITVNNLGHVTAATAVTKEDITALDIPGSDTNTWKANSDTSEGYVASGAGQANKVWKTDANGVPAWRSDSNSDTKVTQTATTSNANYPLLLAPSGQTANTTTTSYFDSGVTLNPSTNTIVANISGTATALATPRAINGTNFDGSAAITTSHWGTARTLTIGNKGQSVNGSGNITWTLADIGAVPKIEGSTSGSYTVYRALGNIYKGSTAVTYYRIALPQATSWGMIMMKLAVRENYNSTAPAGEIIIYANHSSTAEWNNFSATCIGNLSTDIKVYGSDKKYFYIAGNFSYSGLSVELMTVGDAAANVNLSDVVLDTVSALPSTYQTATMYYSLHSGNYASFIDDRYVNVSGDTMTGTLILSKTTDASGTANNKPALIVGGTDTQAHIEIDANEIMAKASGTTVAELHLNADGGKVNIGNGGLFVGTSGISTTGDIHATNTATTDRSIRATNANGSVSIHTSTNRGLYDHTRAAWIIYSRASDNTTRIPQHLYTDNGYITASTTMYLSSASGTSLIFRKGTTAHARFDTSGHFIPETTAIYNLGGTEKLWNTIHGHHLQLLGTTDATMTAASTNPRITFAEGTGSQPVHLIYTDYDNYRSPAGLKVIGGTSATPAWFEVEGTLHAARGAFGGYNNTTYALSTASFICDSWVRTNGATGWYNETHGGGWYMTDANYVRSYNSKAIYVNNNIYVGTTAGNGTGLALYSTSAPTVYGIHMSTTANYGKFGDVQSDWATYFNMNAVGQRGWIYRAGSTNVASVSANGVGTFKGIMGETGHVVSPDGGRYTCTTGSITGYLKITLPVSWDNTMFRFAVDIFDYSGDNAVTYLIGGYNYDSPAGWHQLSAQCVSKWGATMSNLDVHFGHDGSKCAIYIGTASTKWSYPQVIVRDVLVGYGKASNIATWSKGWSIGFTTTIGSNIVTKSNTNTGYSVNIAAKTGDESLYLYPHNSNELNFGGSNTSTTIYIGYRAMDSRPVPTKFIFGGASGSADLQAKTIYLGSGTTSYISSSQYTGNAATATKATTATKVVTQFDVDTSRYRDCVQFYKADGSTIHGFIGMHNTGNTNGAIIINPNKNADKDSWDNTQGLYVGSTVLKFWNQPILHSGNYNSYAPTLTGAGASGTWGINITGDAAYATKIRMASTGITSTGTTDGLLEAGIVRFDTVGAAGTDIDNDGVVATFGWSSTYGAQIWLDDGSGPAQMRVRNRTSTAWNPWRKVWMEGDAVTGAVWNDYAEYRESDCQEFGRVLSEKGDDTLTITTARLQPFAGISSDTWGFCQGETEKAKTPIAVAGRVLAYTYKDRNEYKPGDCVCAAPNGTVDIMTREEIIQYPDRIVGTVSCVPDYETWGSGDRDPVQVNGRIWIKVK